MPMNQKRKNISLFIGVGLMALVAWSALTSAAEPAITQYEIRVQ